MSVDLVSSKPANAGIGGNPVLATIAGADVSGPAAGKAGRDRAYSASLAQA